MIHDYSRLRSGMYDSTSADRPGLFELHFRQLHDDENQLVHNAGWYNMHGKCVGMGDLSAADMQRISEGLRTLATT